MLYTNKFSLFFLICNIFICNISGQPSQAQISDLTLIKNAYGLAWDLTPSTTCISNNNIYDNYILCDSTNTKVINLHVRSANSVPFPVLVNLIYVTELILNYVVIDNSFWGGLPSYSSLDTLEISSITFSQPPNFGVSSNFPATLKTLSVPISFPPPEQLFTGNLKSLMIKVYTGFIFPTLTQDSTLNVLHIASSNDNFLTSNFVQRFQSLEELSFQLPSSVFTFDDFDKLLNLKSLVFNEMLYTTDSNFPSSIFRCTKLTDITLATIKFFNNITLFDFSNTSVSYINLATQLTANLVYPGIIYGTNITLKYFSTVTIGSPLININALDLNPVYSMYFQGKINDPIPSTIWDINGPKKSIINLNSAGVTGVIPDALCSSEAFDIANNQITDIPSCMKCVVTSKSYNIYPNPNLPVYTATTPCLTTEFNYTPVTINTKGTTLTITGKDLGYDAKINSLRLQYIIPNYKIRLPIPAGGGANKQVNVTLFPNEPFPIIKTISYGYYPPTISSISLSTFYLDIFGDNLGLTLANTIKVAGVSINTYANGDSLIAYRSSFTTQILTNPTIFRVILNVVDQSTSYIYNTLVNSPSLDSNQPIIISQGGIASFSGTGLTLDHTILNLTIDGLQCNTIVSTKTNFTFNYPVFSVGYKQVALSIADGLYSLTGSALVLNPEPIINTPPTFQVTGGVITIQGTWFYNNASLMSISIEGSSCTIFSSTPTSIIFEYPSFQSLKPKQLNLKINVNYYSVFKNIVFEGPEPTLSNPLPSLNLFGGSGTFTGTNLGYTLSDYTLTIGGQPCTITISTTTTISFTYPSFSTPGIKTVILDTLSLYSFSSTVTMNGPIPSFTTPFPKIYQNGGSASFKGTNLQYDITNFILKIDNIICTITSSNPTTIFFDYPPLTPGYKSFSLNTSNLYQINDQILVIGLDPIINLPLPTLSPNGGDLTLTGTNLINETEIYKLTIGGSRCSIINASDTSISFTYPKLQKDDNLYLMILTSYDEYNYYDYLNIELPIIPCKNTAHGKCINNTLVCDNGWSDNNCSSTIIIVDPTFNNTSPDSSSNSTTTLPNGDKIQFSTIISVIELREYDGITNKQVNTYPFKKWVVKEINNQQFQYSSNITTKDGSLTLVQVNVTYFISKQIIEFANQSITMEPSTIKYQISLSSYSFQRAYNKLMVVMEAGMKGYISDSCSSMDSGIDRTSSQYIKLQINEVSLYGKFIQYGVIDNRPSLISNTFITSQNTNQSDQISSKIGIMIPHYTDSVLLDPDFSLLLDINNSAELNPNSVCSNVSESKKKLTKSQLAGIIIASVVFGLAAIAVGIYITKRYLEDRNLNRSLSNKLRNIN